ncbi:hypothetical protein Fmac_025105 [Flemingia macrophylla]|uniref:Uncharacterized protein n=1 Tax=Flemingia macrophylla TaxID=520843 RepID=A0ABD1LRB0_9FABA
MKMLYLGKLVLLLALTIFSSSPVLATRDLSPPPGEVPSQPPQVRRFASHGPKTEPPGTPYKVPYSCKPRGCT